MQRSKFITGFFLILLLCNFQDAHARGVKELWNKIVGINEPTEETTPEPTVEITPEAEEAPSSDSRPKDSPKALEFIRIEAAGKSLRWVLQKMRRIVMMMKMEKTASR